MTDPRSGRFEMVEPLFGEERPSVLPHPGGPIALQSVKGNLSKLGLIEQVGDIPSDFER